MLYSHLNVEFVSSRFNSQDCLAIWMTVLEICSSTDHCSRPRKALLLIPQYQSFYQPLTAMPNLPGMLLQVNYQSCWAIEPALLPLYCLHSGAHVHFRRMGGLVKNFEIAGEFDEF